MAPQKTRIVLIDDHVLLREGLKSLLHRDDFEVVGEGGTGEEAIELANRLRPDVLVLDLTLEGINGIEAAKRISALPGGPAIVVLSVHRSADVLERALAAGARGYVLKRSDFKDLVQAIACVLRGEMFVSTGITERMSTKALSIDEPGDFPLTARELEILELVAEGFTSKEIATKLGVSPKTVSNHRANMMEKLNISSTAGLVRYFLSRGQKAG